MNRENLEFVWISGIFKKVHSSSKKNQKFCLDKKADISIEFIDIG